MTRFTLNIWEINDDKSMSFIASRKCNSIYLVYAFTKCYRDAIESGFYKLTVDDAERSDDELNV